jgi:primosomal protein N' (replication factor Y)
VSSPSPDQQGLFPAPARPRTTAGFSVADTDPVVAVQVIGVLPHLDRPFEYAVPAEMDEVGPGMRVKVRLAGKEHDGIVLERRARAGTDRPLAPLGRLVSDDVVISPAMLRVCADVAARCAGTVSDVLRLALPPRHARAEKADRAAEQAEQDPQAEPAEQDTQAEPAEDADATDPEPPSVRPGDRYAGLSALVLRAGAEEGPVPRAAIVLDPVDAWWDVAADAVADLDPGAGALLVAPDQRDVRRASAALSRRGVDHEVLMSADGPEKRYRAFRRILRGASRVVVGNRSAAFAPVRDLALAICVDPADDLLVEPRAPYPHLRTVLQCRSAEERCALLLLGSSISAEVHALVESGYLRLLEPVPAPHAEVRPHIVAMDQYLRDREGPSGHARIPREAMRVIRQGIERGPVLVQVPRTGYVPAVACTFCGTRCRCPQCGATLSMHGHAGALSCTVCGRREDAYRCPECGRTRVRAIVSGSGRTAEELHRGFPDAQMRIAGGAQGPVADDDVPDGTIVVATPGAEPAPEGRYAAAVLLDADAMLARAAFDADLEAVRRWSNAIALVRTAAGGGEVLVVGTATLPAIRDLVAYRSSRFLGAVMEDRRALDLPPVTRVAEAVGDRGAVKAFLAETELPDATSVFGPVDAPTTDAPDRSRAVIRIEMARSQALADALRAGVAARTARKVPGSLRVRMDPADVF